MAMAIPKSVTSGSVAPPRVDDDGGGDNDDDSDRVSMGFLARQQHLKRQR